MNSARASLLFSFLFAAVFANLSFAGSDSGRQGRVTMQATLPPFEPKDIAITEHLGDTVDIQNLTFKDEAGKDVKLASYFGTKKPILLNLVYYNCPSLCGLVLQGILAALKELEWTPGNQFEVVSVSIDSRENPELAARKKETFFEAYGRPEGANGWHFLTGTEAAIKKLSGQVGFGFRWDPKSEQFAHSAAIFILTPEGKISRYLYGVNYYVKDLKLGLLEASGGKIGTVIDRILLFCYRYDPITRKYSIMLFQVMKFGAALTMLFLGGYLAVFWRRQRFEAKAST